MHDRLWFLLIRLKLRANPGAFDAGSPESWVCGVCEKPRVRYADGLILCFKCDP